MTGLERFVAQSNLIEGIRRDPLYEEVAAHRKLLKLRRIQIEDLQAFVDVIQPGSPLREQTGRNVRVGMHVPIPGGPEVPKRLGVILRDAEAFRYNPEQAFDVHIRYETLHPFMDGNGRSGRALLLWQVGGGLGGLDFLHWWYYASLQNSRP